MARKIENKLSREELVKYIGVAGENATFVFALIDKNWGRDPIIWRRARTIVQKLNELSELIEEMTDEPR